MLVENLYPDKIAPSLFEESVLSSGTLEEVALNPQFTVKQAMKMILRGIVKYQKEKGPGREFIDILRRSLSEIGFHLLHCLQCVS